MIRFVNVKKRLGTKQVLDGLDLEVREGETFVVIGRSGTGKSVTLKHIVGLMKPDSGEVYVYNEPVHAASPPALAAARRKIGFLFQNGALLNSLDVFENVALPLREHAGWDEKRIQKTVEEKLALVGLAGQDSVMPADLSGGMRKRVSLARAIVLAPRIVLYDEPTTGLDPIMSNVINQLVLDMKKKLGITSIVVTHDMGSAILIADRIGMLYRGRLLKPETPQEITQTTNPIVRQFIEGKTEGPLTDEEEAALQEHLARRRP